MPGRGAVAGTEALLQAGMKGGHSCWEDLAWLVPGLGSHHCISLSRLGCRAETSFACTSQGPGHTQELAQEAFRMPFCCGSDSKGRDPRGSERGALALP